MASRQAHWTATAEGQVGQADRWRELVERHGSTPEGRRGRRAERVLRAGEP